MRRYELMLVLRPDVADDRSQAVIDRTTRQIVASGGQIVKVAPWGRRRLAYPIQRHREGSYHIVLFQAAGDALFLESSPHAPARAFHDLAVLVAVFGSGRAEPQLPHELRATFATHPDHETVIAGLRKLGQRQVEPSAVKSCGRPKRSRSSRQGRKFATCSATERARRRVDPISIGT